jgi:hypothetical protein
LGCGVWGWCGWGGGGGLLVLLYFENKKGLI